jgi:TonB family protein
VLHLDELAPCPPHLPKRKLGALAQLAISMALHVALVVTLVSIKTAPAAVDNLDRARSTTDLPVSHVVFLAPELPMGGGGGGGGNQQPGPIRRAQGIGTDTMTLRTRKTPPAPISTSATDSLTLESVPQVPSIVLDAKPLASGLFEQVGLPATGLVSGTSTGPGSGGGVGTGIGTGIGSGRGPGLGPGSGGGTGGGVYRAGGAVSSPFLIKEIKPRYTPEALRRRIEGTVVLEAIVTRDGCASEIRVVKSLDSGGLDEEAVLAVSQWRFEPGRRMGVAVDVLVTIEVTFLVR